MRYSIWAAFAAVSLFTTSAWACLEAPLPTAPSGPTWSVELDGSFSTSSRISELTIWRQPCEEGEPVLLATFEPLAGTPFICATGQFQIVQSGTQFGNFRLHPDPNLSSSFCGDLLVKSTFLVGQRTTQPQWDTTGAFTLFWDSDTTLEVGAFEPADYGQESGPRPLNGSMSGSWFEPARSGEGFALEFAQTMNGPVGTIYWFTHRDGVPYWLIGSTHYDPGQTEISFELLEASGTGFGAEFDPAAVEIEPVGVLSLEFDSCRTGFAAWEMADGETGTFDLERIAIGLHDAECE